MNDFEMQIELAKKLPDIIEIVEDISSYKLGPQGFTWKDTKKDITEREWDWIVNEVKRRYYREVSGYDVPHRWFERAHFFMLETNKEYYAKQLELNNKAFNEIFEKIF